MGCMMQKNQFKFPQFFVEHLVEPSVRGVGGKWEVGRVTRRAQ